MCPWTASRSAQRVCGLILAIFLLFPFSPALALTSPEWDALAARLWLDGFDQDWLRQVFSDPVLAYDPQVMAKKMNSLLRIKLAQARPAPPGPPPADVYESFLRPEPLAEAREYVKQRAALLRRVSSRYTVPQEVLVSMLLIETRLGTKIGERGALAPLASMAATVDVARIRPLIKSDQPLEAGIEQWLGKRTREKADWAYAETAALLRYAQDLSRAPMDIPGSVYGAIGFCQFMPTNIAKLGVDGDGDGKVDLFNHEDALASMANYLHQNGWTRDMNAAPTARRGKKGERIYNQRMLKTIYTYNHSWTYCRTILAVAAELKSGKPPAPAQTPGKPPVKPDQAPAAPKTATFRRIS